jgi:hypothetical protein
MGGSVAGDAFWTTVNAQLNALAAPIGLIESAPLSASFTRNGSACLAPASN